MSVISHLHILKNGQEEQAEIYSTVSECPEPNLKVKVNNSNGYVKLGNVDDYYATRGRVHRSSDNKDYAILKKHKVSDFPNSWGNFKYVTFTAGLTEDGNDWLYIFSMHFDNGSIPFVVRKNGTSIERNDNYFENNTSDKYNSAFYYQNKWNNAVAKDLSNALRWEDINGNNYRSMSYTLATTMNFNNGNNTVVADDTFTSAVSGDRLTIYKNGSVFKTYTI